MKILDKYMELQNEVLDYFGYRERAVGDLIVDRRNFYWTIEDDNKVNFDFTVDTLHNGTSYVYEICFNLNKTGHGFVPGIYRGKDYTMIAVDINDRMVLAIYDNEKEK